MKRASYRDAIVWVAANDSGGNPDSEKVEPVSELITSCLVADIFGVDSYKVGRDVVAVRKKWRRSQEFKK